MRALGAGILIKTDKRKMHVNVHFSWLLERIAGDIKQREKRGNEMKSFGHNKELQSKKNPLMLSRTKMFPMLHAAVVFMVASTFPPRLNL